MLTSIARATSLSYFSFRLGYHVGFKFYRLCVVKLSQKGRSWCPAIWLLTTRTPYFSFGFSQAELQSVGQDSQLLMLSFLQFLSEMCECVCLCVMTDSVVQSWREFPVKVTQGYGIWKQNSGHLRLTFHWCAFQECTGSEPAETFLQCYSKQPQY